MNNFPVDNIIKKFGEANYAELNNVEIFLQQSKSKDIVFYQLEESAEAFEKLCSRLEKASLGLLVLSSEPMGDLLSYPYMVVKGERFFEFQKEICDFFWGPTSDKASHLGITGTNGKTSTAFILMQLLNQLGKKALFVGTIGLWTLDEKLEDSSMTSPDYITVRQIIHRYADEYDYFVWEVSSHGLELSRFFKINFSQVGWMNFSQDHLDYHGDIESYFKAKLKIKNHMKSNQVIFIPKEQRDLIRKVSMNQMKVEEVSLGLETNEKDTFWNCHYNKENLSVAIKIVEEVTGEIVKNKNIEKLVKPPGRFTVVEEKGKTVIIDYAHTPDALENICLAIQKSFKGRRLIVLFGCGGNRDSGKRVEMGRIACLRGDEVVVTTDNPRFEEPVAIVKDIMKGAADKKTKVIIERKEAIKKTITAMSKENVLLIAGKGHEPYMEIKGVRHEYSDEAWVRSCLEEVNV